MPPSTLKIKVPEFNKQPSVTRGNKPTTPTKRSPKVSSKPIEINSPLNTVKINNLSLQF